MSINGDIYRHFMEHYRANPSAAFGDGGSFLITLGTVMDILPSLAALLSIIWLCLRIWADPQVQCWVRKRRCEDVDKV